MKELLFAAIADDDTGASDLAGMFADQGVRVVLVLDVPQPADLTKWTKDTQGVIFATATRALAPADAFRKTAEAAKLALDLSPRTLQIKYCSTFDSTEQGNIGPSIDAAMEITRAEFTVAMPALPVNGRTTYCGYHFVKGQLLSDSPMRLHPLTPMTNANLADHLSHQTRRRIGLTPYSVVDNGPEAITRHWQDLQSKGIEISIVDCLNDRHAADISDAAVALPLITGGSAFGTHLPAAWRRRGWLGETSAVAPVTDSLGCGALVVAGSCSLATASQNAWLEARGAITLQADPIHLLLDRGAPLIEEAIRGLRSDTTVLVKTPSTPDAIEQVRAWGRKQGIQGAELGLRIANALASATRSIVAGQQPRTLIIAGGETSSAICRELGVRALGVGRNIQPGVPLCFPIEGPKMPMALKSGNFGTEDFYAVAIEAAGASGCLVYA